MIAVAICLSLTTSFCNAQIPSISDVTSTPLPGAGHSYIQTLNETVNPANGAVSLRIAAPMPKSRGFTVPFTFAYDSNGVYYLSCFGACVNGFGWKTTTALLSQGGWSYSAPMLSVQASHFTALDDNGNPVTCTDLNNFVMQDTVGNRHNLGLTYYSANNACSLGSEEGPITTAQNGSILATTTSGLWFGGVLPATVTDADGMSYNFPYHTTTPEVGCNSQCPATAYPPSSIVDRNGNTMQISSSAVPGNGMSRSFETERDYSHEKLDAAPHRGSSPQASQG